MDAWTILLCFLLMMAISEAQEASETTTTESTQTTTIETPFVIVQGELRRSGRFQCQEQTEDLERLQRLGEKKCRCPTIFAPVCGSDGETYHNRCFLNCTAAFRYQGFATSPLTLQSWGPCPVEETQS